MFESQLTFIRCLDVDKDFIILANRSCMKLWKVSCLSPLTQNHSIAGTSSETSENSLEYVLTLPLTKLLYFLMLAYPHVITAERKAVVVWDLVTGAVLCQVDTEASNARVLTNGEIVAVSAYLGYVGGHQTILYSMKDLIADKDCGDEIWSRRLVDVSCDCMNETKIVDVRDSKVLVKNFWV